MRREDRPHVILAAPENVDVKDIDALTRAFTRLEAAVSKFRDDIFFHSDKFEAVCRRATHFLLLLGNSEFRGEKQMLTVAAKSRIETIGMVCLGSCDALKRHQSLFTRGRIDLVVTRSYLDNGRTSRVLGMHVGHSVVAESIVDSARLIAESVLHS
ncbi:hypothetical protein C4556_00400 [Candidatus Parcubacteria bacterium]|nr:MAG: hypothetical protein C4556_00400 [Candidatus Parcubacteria bacterium]